MSTDKEGIDKTGIVIAHDSPDRTLTISLVVCALIAGIAGLHLAYIGTSLYSFFVVIFGITGIFLTWLLSIRAVRRWVAGRKITEKMLRESEERFRTLIDHAPVGIYLTNREGDYLFVTERWRSLAGLSLNEAGGKGWMRALHPEDRGPVSKEWDSSVRACREFAMEYRFQTPHGEVLWLAGSATPLHNAKGEVISYLGTVSDITKRKLAEEALKKSEKDYRTLVDNALVGVYRSNLEGRFLYINDALARMFECDLPEEMLSKDVLIRYKDPKDREYFIENLKKKGKVSNYEVEVPTKSGRLINILLSATLEGDIISGMALDITEQKRLEEQLRQSQKMEAIGQLAGGIAHDFNNVLSTIIGYGHILNMKMGEDDPLRVNVQQMLASADRAAGLTHSLLAFSRKQIIDIRPVNLNDIIKKMEKFLLRVIGEDVELRTVLTQENLNIMADSGQLEQVLMNLATNARDAMPHGGELTIETGSLDIDERFIRAHGFGNPGTYAVISVTDTGKGMDEETRKRIFEPFFTTKEAGQGTGLGLSIVYGIVKQHNGYINVYSEARRGTTFRIYLPTVGLRAEERPEDTTEAPSPPAGGSETILIAEDDPSLRKLSRIVLEEFGYKVIEAEDGEDAIKKFIEHEDDIRLCLLDMIMPKKNGKEAYDEISRIRPGVKALFASGYTADIEHRKGTLEEGPELLLKPVSPRDLVKKVREILDR